MIALEDFNLTASPTRPCALTIGSFDGVHLGHQEVLRSLRKLVGPEGTVAVFTFSNHPSHALPGREPACLIASKPLKLNLLEKYGVDIAYCIPFTLEFASLSYDAFLSKLQERFPFDHLILGEGATLGKKREGTSERVQAFAKDHGFEVHYLKKVAEQGEIISSGQIRKAIARGNLAQASRWLGRPFAIMGQVQEQEVILPPHLCLPPDGTYSVRVDGKNALQLVIKNRTLKILSGIFDTKVLLEFE